MFSLERAVVCSLALLTSAVYAVKPVEVQGQDFVVADTGDRFVIVGVDYQPGGQAGYKPQEGEDALTNGTVCLRDAALLQGLGVNTIRVYNVDPTLNHDDCASIFNAVGIYMLMDVNAPFGGESLNRADPESSYHVGYLSRTFGVVEAFAPYPNTLGFFAANEVINDLGTADENPRYIRAVQRDLKNYIKNNIDRAIPVGYSAADVREVLEDTWAYLQCAIDGDEDDMSRSDFFGLNSYSWCGSDATFDTSGYDDLVEMFGSSTIPVFFSEYGCNDVQPRVFDEVQALYGRQMTSLSGGLVYEYSQEEADFGLVDIHSNGSVTLRVDFDNLQGQYNELDLSIIQSSNDTAVNLEPPECGRSLISSSQFSTDFDIPETPDDVADLISNGLDDPNRGQIVDVDETEVPMECYGTNGNVLEDLAIRPLPEDQSNTPSGEDTSGGATGTGAAPSATSSGAAVPAVGGVPQGLEYGAFMAFLMWLA
ncbi:Glucanosyltransferase-domain-containing protein [Lineolata rhizophorae]|uniref:1,3-beta-glucanosyltransferase n=1 Tax=Lineolata rhizophorae TaxID=578093 RepID=A0A6A6P502_9PEZI|nr:Glucanosyltransferase-domain-containing protein [Lineolata rhizophorae]